MPGRYIRVRNIAEHCTPGEDTLAVAMPISGATHIETLDTRGAGGAGGQPNDHPLKWADEYLGILTK